MRAKRNYRWQEMDKSNTDLSILIRQYEVHNKTEGKSDKTVGWYNDLLGLFYQWLKSEAMPTTLLPDGSPTGNSNTGGEREKNTVRTRVTPMSLS